MLFWLVFMFFYPRIMLSQIMWKLEKTAEDIERMSDNSKRFIINTISKKPDKRLKESVTRFFEFFLIEPVSLDPFGIIKKFDHLIKEEKDRFRYFVNQIAPHMNSEQKACLEMGLAGGINLHQIAKIVRHYVELVRKTKNIQIAIVLQMQLPLIERIAKAVFKGTKSLTRGDPIGDGLGPLVVASLMKNNKFKEIEEDIIMSETKINGRTVFLLKAKGPGGRIGYPGKAVAKLVKKHKISRIITVDAAAKLEGEKTGSVAEGVGVAMGGPGVERSYIETIATEKNIPLDSIIVKMSSEEAITPMRKSIIDAVPEVIKTIERCIDRTKKGDKVIVVGVGNTSGIGNNAKEVKSVEEWVKNYEKKLKMENKIKKESSFFL